MTPDLIDRRFGRRDNSSSFPEGEIVKVPAAAVFTRAIATSLSLAFAIISSTAAQAHSFKIVHAFTGGADGGNPAAGLVLDATGNLYGTTSAGAGTVFELAPKAGKWSESTLHTFSGSDGAVPYSSLIFDGAGNLYGVTYQGGAGYGVAYELTPGSGSWTETVLYSFQGGTAGSNPVAALAFDKNGNLYGTLPNGGDYNAGIAYQLTNSGGSWQEEVLYNFSSWEPEAPVILDKRGDLYSTAPLGPGGGGEVWELLPGNGGWQEKTLYSFATGGAKPEGGLVFDKAGNLYGQTEIGGTYKKGVVFKLAPTKGGKWKETVLYNFKGGMDGEYPTFSVPVFDKHGNLYGTTTQGGGSGCGGDGCGTVFTLTRSVHGKWKETVLHRFKDSDGMWPYAGVVIDAAGNLYGTTGYGGNPGCLQNSGCGVVFEITP
jgi:hypothetical protein